MVPIGGGGGGGSSPVVARSPDLSTWFLSGSLFSGTSRGLASSAGGTIWIDGVMGYRLQDLSGALAASGPLAGSENAFGVAHRSGTAVNAAPAVTILTPSSSVGYAYWQTIEAEGAAEDPEDGEITDDSAYVWRRLNGSVLGTGRSIEIDLSDFGEESSYLLILEVTDSAGAKGVATVMLNLSGS